MRGNEEHKTHVLCWRVYSSQGSFKTPTHSNGGVQWYVTAGLVEEGEHKAQEIQMLLCLQDSKWYR